MESKQFLENIAMRLGRTPRTSPAARSPERLPAGYQKAPLGKGLSGRAERFKHELELVGGKVALAASMPEVHALLRAEIELHKARRIVSWANAELAAWGLAELLTEVGCTAHEPSGHALSQAHFRSQLLAADLGITCADFAIANTGTLALSSGAGRPRSVSLLPTVHVALLRETQLVDRLGQAFDGYRSVAAILASNVYFITGPSRTSDIENDLSIGVHGPAAVSVILWRDLAEGRSP